MMVKVQNGAVSPLRMALRLLGNARYDYFPLVYFPNGLIIYQALNGVLYLIDGTISTE